MRLALAVLFALFLTGVTRAQLPAKVFTTSQKIRFLQASRQDVRELFAEYESDLDDDDSDTFKAPGLEVEVSYASGECSDTPDSNRFVGIWNVKSGKVVKVEITFDEPVALAEFALDTSALTKEQQDEDDPDSYVEFSKVKGIMFDIGENGVERIILFPPAAKARSLCHDNTWGKGFYSSKAWFDEFQLGLIRGIDESLPANVNDLQLSTTLLEPTSNRTISVVTTAIDPENDVLTYKYSVSGGRIIGTGSKVVWDLIGVPPGTYFITAGVDDGCGVCGLTVTKTVTVK